MLSAGCFRRAIEMLEIMEFVESDGFGGDSQAMELRCAEEARNRGLTPLSLADWVVLGDLETLHAKERSAFRAEANPIGQTRALLAFARYKLNGIEAHLSRIRMMKATPEDLTWAQVALVRPARLVRTYLERRTPIEFGVLERFPAGCCQLSSLLLLRYLTLECGQTGVELVANGEIPSNVISPDGGTHAWLERPPFIIDITADQFGGVMDAVIVTDKRDWHDRFTGQTRHSWSEELSYVGPKLLAEYDAMVNVLRSPAGPTGE